VEFKFYSIETDLQCIRNNQKFDRLIRGASVSGRDVSQPAATASFNYTNSNDFMERVRSGIPPRIISVACNGGIQGEEVNEVIPETADEIAE
jgi:hypothetical protein